MSFQEDTNAIPHYDTAWDMPIQELISSWTFGPDQNKIFPQGPYSIAQRSLDSHLCFSHFIKKNDYEFTKILKEQFPFIEHSDLSMRLQMLQQCQYLYVGPSKIAGLGVFSTVNIPANTPIIQYVGETMRERIADVRESQYDGEGHYGTYIFRIEGDYVIDATIVGGMAKFINHSCNPNCASEHVRLGNKMCIVISSIKDIEPGEELSYDYKLPYEDKSKRIPCHCGALNCRGWMNWDEYHQSLIENPRMITNPNYSSDSEPDILPDISTDESSSSGEESYCPSKRTTKNKKNVCKKK